MRIFLPLNTDRNSATVTRRMRDLGLHGDSLFHHGLLSACAWSLIQGALGVGGHAGYAQ